jgi:tetraacyldisaccharide 4'-kinase
MLLFPFEGAYSVILGFWNWGYCRKVFPIHSVGAKVISIGNLTWGGTGKTPLVEYLARRFKGDGKRVAVLSRGYGSSQDRLKADEVQWLTHRLEGISIFSDPDRVHSAHQAQQQKIEVLILDDGFQHRRLARRLDIIIIDATDPFGNGHLIPVGKLREPLKSLRRANWIILTKTDLVNDGELSRIKEKIRQFVPEVAVSETFYRPICLRGVSLAQDDKIDLGSLKDQNIGIAAAIGNPGAFKKTVEKLGARVTQTYFKRDHSRYSAADFQKMEEIQKKNSLFCWVTTSKDAIKMRGVRTVPIYELEIELVFKEGEKELWQAIESL